MFSKPSEDAGVKPRALGASTVGNQARFSKRKKSSVPKNIVATDDALLEEIVVDMSYCCPKGGALGCIMSLCHSVAISEIVHGVAVNYVKRCRSMGSNSSSTSRDQFVMEKFRESLADDVVSKSGERAFVHTFSIPPTNGTLGAASRIDCCKKAFLTTFGLSEWDWRTCSKALKSTETGRVSSLHVRRWDDATVQEFTFAEAEEVFTRNLRVDNAGNEYVISITIAY